MQDLSFNYDQAEDGVSLTRSVVLGGGLAAGPGSGLGGSGLVGPPPEGYVSANVFSVSILCMV